MTTLCSNWDKESWLASQNYIDCIRNYIVSALGITENSIILDVGCARARITNAIGALEDIVEAIEGVDPAPTILEAVCRKNMLLSQEPAEVYIEKQADNFYDGIIIKQMLHLLPESSRVSLLSHAYRTLKPQSKILVFLMPQYPSMPMFEAARKTFAKNSLSLERTVFLLEGAGFKVDLSNFKYPVKIKKSEYLKLISNRFISCLEPLSEQQLAQGIRELEQSYRNELIEFDDSLYVVHGIKHQASV